MSTTPAPWKWIPGREGEHKLIGPVKDEAGKNVGPVHIADVRFVEQAADGSASLHDDAGLIAAAPELLAMLEEFEWGGMHKDTAYCKFCGEYEIQGHKEDCRLAHLLASARGGPK